MLTLAKMVNLHLWKGLSNQACTDLSFELTVETFCRLAGSDFQADAATKLKYCSPKDFKLCWEIFKSFLHEDQMAHDV